MTLTLRVLQTPKGVEPVAPRPLDPLACPLAIGRGADNDWVLEDPDRHISKVHCRIEAEGDGLYLVDTSSNGVFFAAESRPLGRGKRRPLDSGDSFRIGDYRIAVAREVEGKLPTVLDGPDPETVPGESAGVSGILAGMNGGSEQRAARSISGDASDWLETLPVGSVADQIVQPLGWHAPPATTLTDVPQDMSQPLSDFASRSEHVPAINGALQIGGAATLLPMDWNAGEDTLITRPQPTSGGEAGWSEAQAALMEGATLTGLVQDKAMAGAGRDVMLRSGQLMRRLVDALAAVEAVQRTTALELGLADDVALEEDLPSLLAAALWQGDNHAIDVLAQRVAGISKSARALGLSLAETATEVGAQIEPEAVEESAREEARLAVGPLLRAASWERYCAVHANLSGTSEAPAADVVLAPLRRFFAQRQ